MGGTQVFQYTEIGISRVLDLADAGLAGSNSGSFTSFNNGFLHTGDIQTLGNQPWITDGTLEGTTLLAEFEQGVFTGGAIDFIVQGPHRRPGAKTHGKGLIAGHRRP